MRNTLLLTAIFTLFAPIVLRAQEGAKMDIDISSAVLKTADWAGYKYMENLDLAQSGDQKALRSFFEFSGTVDGTESLQHATTCLELIPFATDEKVGSVISSLKPNLKKILLERLTLAQGRTKKENLRKPLTEWAPNTWKALNGETVTCNSCMMQGGTMMKKPEGVKPPTPGTHSTTTDTEKQ